MYRPACHWILVITSVALVALSASAAIAQQPGTVSLRPRVTANAPGVPNVKVTVDRSRVPLGDEVTFTLSPSNVIRNQDFLVTLYFGDGSQQVMHQATVVHLYRSSGDYVYAVLVKRIDSKDPDPSQRIPEVKLSANPLKIVAGNEVNFAAQLSSRYPGLLYRFIFGDQADSGWQNISTATHAYFSPGNYEAFVDIGIRKNDPLKRSNRVAIQVAPRQVEVGPVDLFVNPGSVDVGGSVTLTAKIDSRDPNLRYRFSFGDNSPPTSWQADSQTTHSYSAAGTYTAQVEVGLMNRRAIAPANRSAARQVEVRSVSAPSVVLYANPTSIQVGGSVSFKATVNSAKGNFSYRFDFGDGSQGNWQSNAEAQHTYGKAGSYSARVNVRALGTLAAKRAIASKPVSIEVSTTNFSVDLTVNPSSVLAGLPAFFSATSKPASPQTKYRFSFGDGSPSSAWSSQSIVTHSYRSSGNYSASVQITQSSAAYSKPLASSTKQVSVQPLPTPTRKPTPTPTPTPTRQPTPTPTPTSTPTPTPYSTAPTPSPSGTATPSPGGTSSPSPKGSGSPVIGGVSPSASSSPTPAAPGSSDDWWKYLILAFIILIIAYQVLKIFLVPRPTFVPHADAGVSSVSKEGGPLGFDLQVELDRNVGDGDYGIETGGTGLIKSKRSDNG